MNEKLLELLNTYAKSSYELDNNIVLDTIRERIQLLHAWDINKTPSDLFRYTEERLTEIRNNITSEEIAAMELTPEEAEGLTEDQIIEKKKDKILAHKVSGNTFWNNSTQRLINYFQEQFMPLLNEDDPNNEEETKYSEQMKIIKNRHRIKVDDLNDNFQLISEGITKILKDVLSDEKGIYKNFFKLVISDLMPLWENILYLWIMYILKDSVFNIKPLIKYVYLNENDFFPSKRFDFNDRNNSNISLAAIGNKLRKYVHEYQNCNLIIIPIIRLDNYENGYYAREAYPGIFYHPAILNNKLFKPNEKFIVYPFTTITNEKVDSFTDGQYINISMKRLISKREFYLGKQAYGYTTNGDDLYYAAPFDLINDIREIYPKKYYSAIRTKLNMVAEQSNSGLILKDFNIKCYDAVQENLNNESCEIGSITFLNNIQIPLTIPMDLLKEMDVVIPKDKNNKDIYIGCKFNYGVEVEKGLHKISNFRIRLGHDGKLTINSLKIYQNECISGYKFTTEEDYSYLIEYVPFESAANREDLMLEENLNSTTMNTYVGDISSSDSLGYKDNDLLHKHLVWDNKRNNILEDKFVLRIGQHLEKEKLVDSNKTELADDYLKIKQRDYFDYNLNNEIEEKTATERYYNSGTVEIGAYLNIPFIENRDERVTYYPDFLSHIYASDYIVPTQVVEFKNDVPDYFAYRKLYRDYTVNKDCYFQIYTEDGDEDFSGNWSIKMIEVISQQTPNEEYFFNYGYSPEYKKTQSMDEIYNYWHNLPSDILTEDFKQVLPFFSQLCPTSSEAPPKNLGLDSYKVPLRQQVGQDYSEIVNFFFNDLSSTEKEKVYDEITDGIFFNYKDDKIYPMIFTRSREFSHTTGGAPIGHIYEYSLSMLYSISKNEAENNRILDDRIDKSHWNKTGNLTKDTVANENFDLIYQSPEEYRGYYYEADGLYYKAYMRTKFLDRSVDYSADIASWHGFGWGVKEIIVDNNTCYFDLLYGGTSQPWADGIYPVIPENNRLDIGLYNNASPIEQEHFNVRIYHPLCKQAYKVKNGVRGDIIDVSNTPIVTTNFPQTQIVTSEYNDDILDEIYLKDYWDNELLNYNGNQYAFYGFSSVSNFDIFLDNSTTSSEHIDFKTMIFGANIPLIKQDEPFDTSLPRNSQLKGYGWSENENMYGSYNNGGELLGTLLNKTIPPEPVGVQSYWGTPGFKKINFDMDITKYTQGYNLYDDIYYANPNKLAFNSFASSNIKPFLNVYYIPHLNYNNVQIRQYPHIFLYSQKTMFPNENYFNGKTKSNKTSYKIYNENKYIASLREFYRLLPNRNASKIPYPFPKAKTIITINFKTDRIKPSLTDALDKIFTKNFITNYDYIISEEDKINKSKFPKVTPNFAHMPCYLDYTKSFEFYEIWNTFHNKTLSIWDTDFQLHKASPIDIFEERYLYHNKYYNSATSLDNIVDRPLFYGIMADMKNYLGTLATALDKKSNIDIDSTSSKLNIRMKSIFEAGNESSGNPNERVAYLNDSDSLLNIDSPLVYEKENQVINNINLQIIVHWFGPNGKYARKVMTRETTGTPLMQDHFILGDYDFKYRQWTNTWNTQVYNGSQSFADFEADLANQSLFKESGSLETDSGTLNFELYPNNGLTR